MSGSEPRIHVVYDKPRDHPTLFVVRAWTGLLAERGAVAFASLDLARRHCQALGLVRYEKRVGADPVIAEIWAPTGTFSDVPWLPDACEWNSDDERLAHSGDAFHGYAVWSIGGRKNLHLCASCAALPKFTRLTKRTWIGPKGQTP